MRPGEKLREGDRVLVGRDRFGRPPTPAIVAADWDGQNLVSVILEGKTKPLLRAPSHVRRADPRPASGPPLRATRPSTTKAELRANPKPLAPARSPKYLAFVRAHACCACGRTAPAVQIAPHHWAPRGMRGAGVKVSDFRTAPLCARCHDHYHESPEHTLPGLDARTTAEIFLKAQVALMDEWLSRVLERARSKRTTHAR